MSASASTTATATTGHRRRPAAPLHSHQAPSSSSGGPPPLDARTGPPQALFITIGPPCSGKTTWLRSFEGNGNDGGDEGCHRATALHDVAVDDQPGIYVPVPLRDALPLLPAAGAAAAPLPDGANDRKSLDPTRAVILGRSVAERLRSDDQKELGLVLRRLALRTSSAEFADWMLNGTVLAQENPSTDKGQSSDGADRELVLLLIDTVEEVLSRQVDAHMEGGDVIATTSAGGDDGALPPWMPPTVDLFVQDRIFRSDNASALSGIESAHVELRRACVSPGLVAWGNTNTRPREYKQALQLASETGRPVHFVTYYDSDPGLEESDAANAIDFEDDVVALNGDLKELLRRNVERLLRMGRYVPSVVIHTMYKRSQNLVNMVVDQWRKQLAQDSAGSDMASTQIESANNNTQPSASLEGRRISKFEFDRILVRLANFEMNQDRSVVLVSPQRHRREHKVTNQAPQSSNRRAPPRGPAGYPFDFEGPGGGNSAFRRPWDKLPRSARPERNLSKPDAVDRNGQHLRSDGHSPTPRPPHKVRKSTWNDRGDTTMPRLEADGR